MYHRPLFARMSEMTEIKLHALMAGGRAPSPEALAGWEFRGWNHPRLLALLGIRKFVKGFFEADGLEGYNRPPRQDGFSTEWTGAGKPFGFYRVGPMLLRAVNLVGCRPTSSIPQSPRS